MKSSYKLTLVSISIRSKTASFFVMAPMVQGRAVVSSEVVNRKLNELYGGDVPRGVTWSIG